LYLAVATAILVAVTVPLVACARVLALGLSAQQREGRRDELHTRQRALIDVALLVLRGGLHPRALEREHELPQEPVQLLALLRVQRC
jgi:hypothetical protein